MTDPTSQANYLDIASENVELNWTVDWEAKLLFGSAVHDLRVKRDNVEELILDTADLDIEAVSVQGKDVKFSVKEAHPVMGSALHIPLPAGLIAGSAIQASVTYRTTEACTALQWLSPEQTQGKSFQYLFSQCQPIYARAVAPLQDTPSVKITYKSNVSSVLPVLMSAIRTSPPSEGPAHDGKVIGKDIVTYSYSQPIPIPSYLIAIASGNVRYRPFPQFEDKTWKTGIWAEPELLDAAYWEFSEDTARFLAAEEKVVTDYKFGVYDLLVLPPSFPYGGMENACLTFLTPTLLTGDRTLVDVVVHELTHSFFGNGVSQESASHFWLNEGWTTYIERVMQQILHGPAERDFSFLIGAKALTDALKQYESKPKYQRLVIEFEKGEDPDDAYSSIPYEKGANLILHLERTLGGLDVILPYVKDYVETFIGKSINTDIWKTHLYEYFAKNNPEKVKALDSMDWNAWFYGEGLTLPVEMTYDTSLATASYSLATRWDESRTKSTLTEFKETDLDSFNGNQVIVFLERLASYETLPTTHIQHLGSLYRLASSPNAEIRLRFYEIALVLPSPSATADPAADKGRRVFAGEAAKWVVGEDGTNVIKGRMKFCRPIFRAVALVDQKLAKEVFERNQKSFHPIAARLIKKDLGLPL